jgi:hypothetical protein
MFGHVPLRRTHPAEGTQVNIQRRCRTTSGTAAPG